MQGQCAIYRRYNISVDDIARFELGQGLALLANTVPAAFWVLFYIFSDEKLLVDVRAETSALIQSSENAEGQLERKVMLGNIKVKCPLLVSVFREALRVQISMPQTRLILEDTILNEKYLLKKGNVVQMPPQAVHFDAAILGKDVNEFNPRRFMKVGTEPSRDERTMNTGSIKVPAAAFRSFGGGVNYCPGRHFAMTEVLSFITLFVLRFDMKPAAGKWGLPRSDFHDIAASIASPQEDVVVDVSIRPGCDKGTWKASMAENL